MTLASADPSASTEDPRPADDEPQLFAERPPRERFFGAKPLRVTIETAIVGAFTLLWTWHLYHLGDASPRVPIYQDRSDARLIANLVQNIATRGWFETNPHLGAPFGQELYDFPHGGETFQLLTLKVMALFTHDYGLLMNAYFIGGLWDPLESTCRHASLSIL